jgi:predicted DNA-binding ribbon-helix-helix protein
MSLVRSAAEPPNPERLAPRFRVVSIAGERRAFRLEQVFWTALAAIARRNRRDLAGEIAASLRRAPANLNASAMLRASVTADLLDLWELAEARAVRPAWGRVIAALPTPAFAATPSQAVAALNEPMRAVLERRGLPLSASGPESTLGVELAAGAVTQLLRSDRGDFLVCNAVFRSGPHRASCRTRVVQADDGRAERRLILGFPEEG